MTASQPKPVSIIGLPGSGKTTFLAALWHLVQAREIPTRLGFGGLREGNFQHLNDIAARWRSATEQERTQVAGMQRVTMELVDAAGGAAKLAFPDVPGEEFQRMWESREIDLGLMDVLETGNIVLLINGNSIEAPFWVHDEAELCRRLGIDLPNGDPVPWSPALAPTQVQLVSLLQSLRSPPLDRGPRRLAVMITVWDKAAGEMQDPEPFLEQKLPLLHQYLASDRDGWEWHAWGVSAQGGEYDSAKEGAEPVAEAEKLREEDVPSTRIKLVDGKYTSHDLTVPVEWLIQ